MADQDKAQQDAAKQQQKAAESQQKADELAAENEPKPAWNPSTMGPLDDANADAYDVQEAPGEEPVLNAYGKPREPEEKVAPKTDAQEAEAAKAAKS